MRPLISIISCSGIYSSYCIIERILNLRGGRPQPHGGRHLGDLGQRGLQVLTDVDGQGFEGRHVHDLGGALDLFTPLDGSDLYSNAGVSFAVDDAGSYEDWVAALVDRPCIDACNQLIPLSGYAGGSSTARSCAPPAMQTAPDGEGAVLVVHCEWTEVDCVHSGNGSGNESDSGGCSLGRGRVPPGFVPRAVVGL